MRDMFKIPFSTQAADNGDTAASSPKTAPSMHRHFETNGGVIPHPAATDPDDDAQDGGLFDRLRGLIKGKSADTTLRAAIEDYIEDSQTEGETSSLIGHERTLFSNVVKLRDMSVTDVMIPRVDIVAIEMGTSQEDLLALLSESNSAGFRYTAKHSTTSSAPFISRIFWPAWRGIKRSISRIWRGTHLSSRRPCPSSTSF